MYTFSFRAGPSAFHPLSFSSLVNVVPFENSFDQIELSELYRDALDRFDGPGLARVGGDSQAEGYDEGAQIYTDIYSEDVFLGRAKRVSCTEGMLGQKGEICRAMTVPNG